MRNRKIYNTCCGYSKQVAQLDGSFEHPKHMSKLMDKKIMTIFHIIMLLIWTYEEFIIPHHVPQV